LLLFLARLLYNWMYAYKGREYTIHALTLRYDQQNKLTQEERKFENPKTRNREKVKKREI